MEYPTANDDDDEEVKRKYPGPGAEVKCGIELEKIVMKSDFRTSRKKWISKDLVYAHIGEVTLLNFTPIVDKLLTHFTIG